MLFSHSATARQETYALGGATGTAFPIELTTAKFDLTLDVGEDADGIRLRFVYRPDLFEAASVATLAEHTVAVLRAFAEAPDVPLGMADLLTGDERAALLGQDGPANRPRRTPCPSLLRGSPWSAWPSGCG